MKSHVKQPAGKKFHCRRKSDAAHEHDQDPDDIISAGQLLCGVMKNIREHTVHHSKDGYRPKSVDRAYRSAQKTSVDDFTDCDRMENDLNAPAGK